AVVREHRATRRPRDRSWPGFARFETRFQLAWVVAAALPVLLEIPGSVGFHLVGVVCAAALLNYLAGIRTPALAATRR
ncbi:MAG: hypothetical protein WKF60_07330, partial [Ilumatobacter sp.]